MQTLKAVALTRIMCPQSNIPATTALGTINRESGREAALQAGANVVMPNLTPLKYRKLYEIYPGKMCIDESSDECNMCIKGKNYEYRQNNRHRRRKQNQMNKAFKSELAELISGDVAFDIFTRAAFATDASIYQILPMCVIAPKDANDVAAVVKYAKEHNIPIVARGAGSGLAGEALTSGIVLDMPRYMNKIISIEEDGSHIVCEPGVVLDDVNNALGQIRQEDRP